MVGHGVRVHGNEQRRTLPLRPANPLLQRDEHVPLPCQHHPDPPLRQELPLQLGGGGKRDVLFIGSGDADGARVLAAMTGVEYDQRQGGGRYSGRRAASRLGQAAHQRKRPCTQQQTPLHLPNTHRQRSAPAIYQKPPAS